MLKIINHFGLKNQLKKFNEECYELIEAIRDYDNALDSEYCKDFNKLKKHIVEEIADVQVLLNQFKTLWGIYDDEIVDVMEYKINRTLERIESGYYEVKE